MEKLSILYLFGAMKTFKFVKMRKDWSQEDTVVFYFMDTQNKPLIFEKV